MGVVRDHGMRTHTLTPIRAQPRCRSHGILARSDIYTHAHYNNAIHVTCPIIMRAYVQIHMCRTVPQINGHLSLMGA